MYFDTHAHYDHLRFDPDREAVVDQLPEGGVRRVMNVGCDLASSEASVRLAEKYGFFYAAVGSHPDDAEQVTDRLLDRYRLLADYPRVRAIGEIGLDYHYETPPRKAQIAAFEKQLDLAKELGLPVIIHEREAHGDAMDSLRSHPDVTGVFHCYSGSVDMARWLVDRGWYLGFTGVVTFKNARRAVEVAQWMPLDRLVLETDCPYMAPEPCRGQRCDSRLLRYTAARLAQIRGMEPEALAQAAWENGNRLFRIE